MCDVWTFGVVLYEIITGRRSLERYRPPIEQKLIDWVQLYPADSQSFISIIDPRLKDQYSIAAAKKIAKLADCCLNKNPKERPTMGEVVEVLKEAIVDSRGGSPFMSLSSSPSTGKPSPSGSGQRLYPLPLPPVVK